MRALPIDPTPANPRPAEVLVTREQPGTKGLSIFLNGCPRVIVMTQHYFMGPVGARTL